MSSKTRVFTIHGDGDGGRFTGKTPMSAATKAGGGLLRKSGKDSVVVKLRELGVHDKIHCYTVKKITLNPPKMCKIGNATFERKFVFKAKSNGCDKL